ncbi:MAG TPA: hypothetical protein PK676_07840 [Bacteroidales bacterium]|nr:hypothetical protein [Bacteroidales bacterium]HQB56441.1 hypothetical protein [Bacteroidales bacterium]
MIEIQYKIHDKFAVEFKQRFLVRRKVQKNIFAVNTWFFVPNSLDINPQTYGKDQFYRDVKSNVRMITPVYILRDLAEEKAVPFRFLEQSFHDVASSPLRKNASEYIYQIKMVSAIIQSALRDHSKMIFRDQTTDNTAWLCSQYVESSKVIMTRYRNLKSIITVPTVSDELQDHYRFGDEAISQVVLFYALRILKFLKEKNKYQEEEQRIHDLVIAEYAYRRKAGYSVLDSRDRNNNRDPVFRYGLLKKYTDSDLFVTLKKKRDGVAIEQIYYSIAAGVAMIFATVVAFIFQRRFGSVSIPLFVALVISYMLKDRIKELMRYYFAHKRKFKYFDHKAVVRIKDEEIGWIKEGMDFISPGKVPQEVMNLRNKNNLMGSEFAILDEKIILYRKLVNIDSHKLAENNMYQIRGINDIVRFHVNRYTQKMDNPEIPLLKIDEDTGDLVTLNCAKTYFLHIVMQVQSEGKSSFHAYKVIISRKGIQEITFLE